MARESRIHELESLLGCKILQPVLKGKSLEKYHAELDGRDVLIRIFKDDYYGNRFLREGITMRYLDSHNTSFHVPRLVEEWPEYNIRAIEWIEMSPARNLSLVRQAITDLQDLEDIQIPFSLENDLTSHLLDVSSLHIAYQEPFLGYMNDLLPSVPWDENLCLVHGDFHYNNMGMHQEKLVIYDWEYSSLGSIQYDQAYFDVIEHTQLSSNSPSSHIWRALATAAITHWYLQENQFSPKMVVKWIEKLAEKMEKI